MTNKRAKEYGFTTAARYRTTLAGAQGSMKAYFESLGVMKVSDLAFEKQEYRARPE